jgi:hypothetical protein
MSNLIGYKNQLKHALGRQRPGARPASPAIPSAPVSLAEGIFDRLMKRECIDVARLGATKIFDGWKYIH